MSEDQHEQHIAESGRPEIAWRADLESEKKRTSAGDDDQFGNARLAKTPAAGHLLSARSQMRATIALVTAIGPDNDIGEGSPASIPSATKGRSRVILEHAGELGPTFATT